MTPDLDSLRAFTLAATTLNFSAAAARAHLSPAAFSERIRTLEDQLSVRLFERTTRSVRLSPAGARLLPYAQASLAAADALVAAAAGAQADYELTIGTRAELGLSYLTPALDALEAVLPRCTLHLWVADAGALLEAVRQGRIDAMVSSLRGEPAALVSEALHPETYAFVGAPARLAQAPFRGPADAPAHTLLDIDPGLPLFRYLNDAQGGPVWAFGRRSYLGGIGAVRARVLGGHGLAVLPRYFIAPDLEAGDLLVLLPDQPLQSDAFRLSWRSGHPRAEALRQIAATLRQCPLR